MKPLAKVKTDDEVILRASQGLGRLAVITYRKVNVTDSTPKKLVVEGREYDRTGKMLSRHVMLGRHHCLLEPTIKNLSLLEGQADQEAQEAIKEAKTKRKIENKMRRRAAAEWLSRRNPDLILGALSKATLNAIYEELKAGMLL